MTGPVLCDESGHPDPVKMYNLRIYNMHYTHANMPKTEPLIKKSVLMEILSMRI